jgi:glyoxylase-like metal-dependent hydrolase (beta-lactamase superfamily II)
MEVAVDPGTWRELDDGVYVRSYAEQVLNVGLVVGEARCLVIDTRSSHVQGAELAEAVRERTSLPWVIVNTHAHWDHCFGNRSFLPAALWGHRRCAEMLATYGDLQRRIMVRHSRSEGETTFADELDEVVVMPPDHTLEVRATIDLGDRAVELRHLGRGHTDNDIVVLPDGNQVCFAGDLVEQGAPPVYADSFPLDWPATLHHLLELAPSTVVPGHGEVVDLAFVREQADMVARVASLAREAHADGRSVTDAARGLSVPRQVAEIALARAYRQLEGAPPYDPPDQIAEALGLSKP